MGDKKKKQARFFLEHPVCCFCGGKVPATTSDHIPARTCFKGRAYPDTFEFPACARCNAASRIDEMAFSFYVRFTDQTSENYDKDEATKAMEGLRNNLPHLLPTVPTIGSIRAALKRMGLNPAPGRALRDLPMRKVPKEAHALIERYARKVAIALFYREKGRAAPADYVVNMEWGQQIDASFAKRIESFKEFPNFIEGSRPNLQFGNQFSYRFVHAADPDVFAVMVNFGTGISLAGMIVPSEISQRLMRDLADAGIHLENNPWIPVGDNYAEQATPPSAMAERAS